MATNPTLRGDREERANPSEAVEAGSTERAVARRPYRLFIFRWFGWRRLVRDFLVLQLGLALIGLSVAITIQVGTALGEIPRGVIEFTVANRLSNSSTGEGIMVAMLGIAAVSIVVAVALGESFGWGSLVNFVFITAVWIDVFESVVPPITSDIAGQIMYLLVSIVLMAFGTALYVGVGAGAGPQDSMALAIARRLRMGVGVGWAIVQLAWLLIGWVVGGTFGPATFIFAVAIGPAMQLAFTVLGVHRGSEFWSRSPGLSTTPVEARLRYKHT